MTMATTLTTGLERPRTSARSGGIAAIGQACCFVVGLALFGGVVAPSGFGDLTTDPAEQVAYLVDHQGLLAVGHAVIYLLFGALLVVQALALHGLLVTRAPLLARVATAFAVVWAALMFAAGMTAIVGADMVATLSGSDPGLASSLLLSLQMVTEGMGGGIELVGGLWLLLVSVAAARAGLLPRWLNVLGIVAGAAGLASTALAVGDAAIAVFVTAAVTWYVGVGTALLRGRVRTAA